MTQARTALPQRPRKHRGLIATAVIVVLALVAGAVYWFGFRKNDDVAQSEYRDIGNGVGVTQGASDAITAAADDHIAKVQIPQVEQAGSVVHITPDGPLVSSVTLRFKLSHKVDDPRDIVLAVNKTGKAEDWTLVRPTKVEGEYAYYVTDHLSWWEPLWQSFTNLVNATTSELKRQWDGLTGDAFADAEKPQCQNEQEARDKGYSIAWKGAEVLYWCLGLEDGKPVVHVVNKRRYPVFINHKGISVPEKPKSKLGLEMLGRQSFSENRTVMMPFDQLGLNYELAKGESRSFTTEYNGFAESLYQLEFGVTTLVNILTRYGAGGGTISNGAIKISQFDQVAQKMSKALQHKECFNALNTDKPNTGAILSGCFDPAAIADMFGWQGVLVAVVMAAAPIINFFRNSFETLGDLLQGKDQETVTVSFNPPAPAAALFVGKWTVHGAQMEIKKDGTGTYTWNAGPCTDSSGQEQMCLGNASLRFKVNGDSMTGTYTKVWYTADDKPAPAGFSDDPNNRKAGGTFTMKRNDPHTLITSDGTGSRPGNPYLCDGYAENHNDSTYMLCGA